MRSNTSISSRTDRAVGFGHLRRQRDDGYGESDACLILRKLIRFGAKLAAIQQHMSCDGAQQGADRAAAQKTGRRAADFSPDRHGRQL